MQNITRTLTKFEIKAYDLVEDEEGTIGVNIIAECVATAPSMTKGAARAALAEAAGQPMPRGCTVKWAPVGSVTYAMPLDQFIANAEILETA